MCVSERVARGSTRSSVGVFVRTGAVAGGLVTNLYQMEPIPWDGRHVGLGVAGVGEGVGRYPGEVEEDGLFYTGEGGPEEA